MIEGEVIGITTALHLRRLFYEGEITHHEKEEGVEEHQSTHNSGVMCAGVYYKAGLLTARLSVQRIRRIVAFFKEYGVRHEMCGRVVVATDNGKVEGLRTLFERGDTNGLRALRRLKQEQLREVEPHPAGVSAVHVPEGGIIDYAGACRAMARVLIDARVRIMLNCKIIFSIMRAAAGRCTQRRMNSLRLTLSIVPVSTATGSL